MVKLDRGYPLVKDAQGREIRCEYATTLVKGSRGAVAPEGVDLDARNRELHPAVGDAGRVHDLLKVGVGRDGRGIAQYEQSLEDHS